MDVEQKETLDEPVLRQPPPSSHSKQDISVVASGSSKESPKTILSYAVKTGNLLESLKSDPMAADVKWSLFVSAANNYKFDSCLKPFPSQFVKDEEKDIESLVIISIISKSITRLILNMSTALCDSRGAILPKIIRASPKRKLGEERCCRAAALGVDRAGAPACNCA